MPFCSFSPSDLAGTDIFIVWAREYIMCVTLAERSPTHEEMGKKEINKKRGGGALGVKLQKIESLLATSLVYTLIQKQHRGMNEL